MRKVRCLCVLLLALFALTGCKTVTRPQQEGETLYHNEEAAFSMHLPPEWEGQYVVERWVGEDDEIIFWDFYHLPSYQISTEDGGHKGLIFSIEIAPASRKAESNAGLLASQGELDYLLYLPTDITYTPETYEGYRALEKSLCDKGFTNCFEVCRGEPRQSG